MIKLKILMLKQYQNIFSVELVYVLYLISGFIKSLFIGFSISSPIDITLLLALILALYFIFYKIKLPKKILMVFALLFSFILWMLISSFYTSSNSYWQHKFIYFFTNIIAIAIPLLLNKRFRVKRFLFYFIIISTLLNLFFIIKILPYIYINDIYHQISGQYLLVSLLSGLNILFIIIIKFKFRYFTLLILFLNFITLIASGGRGGLVATFVVLFIYALITQINLLLKFKLSLNIFKILIISILLIITTSIYYINNKANTNDLVIRSMGRLMLLEKLVSNSGDSGKSVNERLEHIKFSRNKIFNDIPHFVFGYGIGSYGVEYAQLDVRGYPHNIILEIWFEMGFIGISLFFLFIFYIIKSFNNTNMIWILIYMFLLALKSSNLEDLRIFFAIIAILVIDSLNKNKLRETI